MTEDRRQRGGRDLVVSDCAVYVMVRDATTSQLASKGGSERSRSENW